MDVAIAFCPYCGSPACEDARTKMHDCTSADCRMRFCIYYSRRKRRSPKRVGFTKAQSTRIAGVFNRKGD